MPAAGFPIVGIGGSAGSLVAFQEILRHLSADSGLAVVIVSHQAPSVPSLLAEILAKATSMAVSQASDGTALEPGNVYVAPPGLYLGVHGGVLRHEGRIERLHPPLPIDAFFRSLAQDQQQRAVGVVVSGSGADGALGLAAIRDMAGLTLAQDPQSAEFPGMPASAIATGMVDLVLSPARIAERLLVRTRQAAATQMQPAAVLQAENSLERIIALVAQHTQQDFSEYKRGTIERRIERRLQLHQLGDLAAYARFLENNPAELAALARDWLIGVSSFFRDPEAFAALERALPKLLASRSNGVLRAWVPGCATGQEAYSIAILLLEEIERAQARVQLQIFATDIDPLAIETARAARYPEGIAAEVAPKRLARFFTRDDRWFMVNRQVREAIVFAVQNLLRDPPFTKLDLLSCRNVLIYFTTEAQRRVLPMFHYSLNPGGLLLLGSSESVTGVDELFTPVDRHWKLFRCAESAAVRPVPIEWASRATSPSLALPKPAPGAGTPRGFAPAELLRRHLADHYGPPSVLVDERGQVSQIHGRTGEFLEPAAGQANLNVLDMARRGLRGPLSAAMRAVSRGDQGVAERTARVRTNGGFVPVRIRVTRLAATVLPSPALLIAFERLDERAREAAEPPPEPEPIPPGDRIAELEETLHSTREDLQSTIEALQAANEELASANEEVQSTNEELRTSKEETQSLNEELQTSNADLHAKVESLAQANDDLTNLLAATGIAIVFLDEQLRVRRFTPAAQRLIPLVDSDIGRPLANLSAPLGYPDLHAAARRVLDTLAPSEKEVRTESGAWYTTRISPYRTAHNAIEGIAIVFVDTTRAKSAELGQVVLELEKDLLEAVRDPFLVLDPALRVVRANRAFYRHFGVQPGDAEGRPLFELSDRAWDIPALRQLLERILPDDRSFDDFEVEHDFPRIGQRRLLLNARRVDRSQLGAGEMILLAIEDTTDTQRMEGDPHG